MRKFAEVTVGATFFGQFVATCARTADCVARRQMRLSCATCIYLFLKKLYFIANVISAMPSFPTAVHLRSYSAHEAQIYARRSAAFSEKKKKKTRCQNVSSWIF